MLILLVSSLKKFQEFFFEKIFIFIMIGDSYLGLDAFWKVVSLL